MNLDIETRNAYAEVIQVLKYLPKDDIEKIPRELIIALEENQNHNHNFQFNVNVSLKVQNFSKKAKIILAILFRDYFTTEKQKNIINNVEKYEYNKLHEGALKKYNSNELFKKQKKENSDTTQSALPVVIKKDNFFNKILLIFQKIKEKLINKPKGNRGA